MRSLIRHGVSGDQGRSPGSRRAKRRWTPVDAAARAVGEPILSSWNAAQRSGAPSKLGEPRILERRQRAMPSLDSEREYCFEFQPRPPQADRYPHGPRHRRWLGRARAPGEIELWSRLLQPGCANPFPFSIFVIPVANSVSIAISIDGPATGAAASSPPLFLAFPSVLRRPAGKEAALDHFVASVAQAGDDRDDVLRGVAGE